MMIMAAAAAAAAYKEEDELSVGPAGGRSSHLPGWLHMAAFAHSAILRIMTRERRGEERRRGGLGLGGPNGAAQRRRMETYATRERALTAHARRGAGAIRSHNMCMEVFGWRRRRRERDGDATCDMQLLL